MTTIKLITRTQPSDRIYMVKEFQHKFGQAYDGPPRELPASVAALRKKLVLEEATELVLAMDRGELDEVFDACLDLLYVVYGTIEQSGLTPALQEGFIRVHRTNMNKVLTESRHASKRDSAWDIVKPEGWLKPKLDDLIDWLKGWNQK